MRKHLGGAVDTSLGAVAGEDENDRILNFVPIAETKYIAKAIGYEMVLALQTEYDADGLSGDNVVLFDYVQKALAWYTYAEYLSFASASEGDGGLTIDEKKSPKMWMVIERQNKAMQLGSDMLEEALRLLFTGDFTDFKDSDTYKKMYGLLVNSGDILKLALPPSGGSYRFLLTLWPWLMNMEANELVPIMGQDTYDEIYAMRNGEEPTSAPTAEWLKLRRVAESLVAFAAFEDALPSLNVVITPDGGLRVLSEFDGIRNRSKVSEEQYNKLHRNVGERVVKLRGELKAYLDNNVTVFTRYGTEMYRGAEKIAFMDNERYNTIFGIR
jgi:hypothetical protein